jgi:hypothetical protein
MVFVSLPRSYNTVLSSVSSNMKLQNHRITSDMLMSLVVDAYDHLVAQGSVKPKLKEDDTAFNADSKKGKGRTKRFNGDCNTCRWYGHRSRDCWEEGRGKHGQAPKGWKSRVKKNKNSKDSKDSKSTKYAHAAADDDELDGVWLADGFDDEPEATSTFPYAVLAHADMPSTVTELYDSGASRHLSPYREQFINYVPIPPKPIMAADKCTFNVIERGDIYIEIPNGNSGAQILLKNVLYAPTMGVTLVSISKLTAAGYAALFRDTVCRIFNPRKKLVGEIPVSNGLYHVRHVTKCSFTGVAATVETLTMEELHARLSHIAPATI